jgi:ectoine hydroxylase-related dioxygenase (phytanoyl-CoA dioxygenase family)
VARSEKMQTEMDLNVRQRMDVEGFAIAPEVIDAKWCLELIDAVESFQSQEAVREKSGSTYAVRRLCELVPRVADLAKSPAVRSLITPLLGQSARVVRSLLFDKTPDANWKVPWHQDLTIAVKERREVPGFGPWSVKAGVPHVQPPASVLEKMLTLRLHLDDCGPQNGPLRVLPGSHRKGVLDSTAIAETRQRRGEAVCSIQRGGAMLMWPLLLHASSPATQPGHRRVIHLEFAAEELPGGLKWHES